MDLCRLHSFDFTVKGLQMGPDESGSGPEVPGWVQMGSNGSRWGLMDPDGSGGVRKAPDFWLSFDFTVLSESLFWIRLISLLRSWMARGRRKTGCRNI